MVGYCIFIIFVGGGYLAFMCVGFSHFFGFAFQRVGFLFTSNVFFNDDDDDDGVASQSLPRQADGIHYSISWLLFFIHYYVVSSSLQGKSSPLGIEL